VQRDRDGKYAGFDDVLKRHHMKAIKGAVGYPNARAFVERFIGTIRREFVDRFVFFGKTHLDSVLKISLAYYHGSRPRQGIGNELLLTFKAKRKKRGKVEAGLETISLAEFRCEKKLGSLLKSYSRNAV
jgi:transposase InsO family protein